MKKDTSNTKKTPYKEANIIFPFNRDISIT